MTKLAAPMTRAVAIQASVTRGRSVARGREGARPPPRVERRKVGARTQRESRRTLLEKGRDTFARIGGASGPEHRLRGEAVPVQRRGGAERPPQPSSRGGHRERCA